MVVPAVAVETSGREQMRMNIGAPQVPPLLYPPHPLRGRTQVVGLSDDSTLTDTLVLIGRRGGRNARPLPIPSPIGCSEGLR